MSTLKAIAEFIWACILFSSAMAVMAFWLLVAAPDRAQQHHPVHVAGAK